MTNLVSKFKEGCKNWDGILTETKRTIICANVDNDRVVLNKNGSYAKAYTYNIIEDRITLDTWATPEDIEVTETGMSIKLKGIDEPIELYQVEKRSPITGMEYTVQIIKTPHYIAPEFREEYYRRRYMGQILGKRR